MHDRLIVLYGGSHGVRDQGLLASAIAQPKVSFGGTYLCKDIYDMAATYLFHIIKNHAFIDGNKRTAVLAMLVFVAYNGYKAHFDDATLFDLAISVASGEITKQQLSSLLKKHIS